jgi:creatinine amidohydrolase
MRMPIVVLLCALLLAAAQTPRPERGQRLEDLSWVEAERLLTADSVVVLPLGAASKEHGPHLKLRNDLTLADYLTRRVIDSGSVVVAPTLTYHHYPAFLEYPGSTSLSSDTARDMTLDVVRSLAAYGPRRFYVLNTGISTVRALQPAAASLAADGVLMRFTNLNTTLDAATRGLVEQEGGTHADEVETSMMLYIDPSAVDMSKAVKDYGPPSQPPRLTRQPGGRGTYSRTGIWGDPTRATRDKGRVFVEALVAGILEDITQLRTAPLPAASRTAADGPPSPPQPVLAPAPPVREEPTDEKCSAGDERTIRAIGFTFATRWANKDPIGLSILWSTSGDILHTDGTVERGPDVIMQNRAGLFARREYRGSRHSLLLTMVRCLSRDIAVADGRWDLRGVVDAKGSPVPIVEGQATLVVKRGGDGWLIEAYRYTVKPQPGTDPTLLKRPGSSDPIIR